MSTLKVDTIQSSTGASPVTINDTLNVAGNTAVTGTLSATGATSLAAGSVSAPGLYFGAESDTGFYLLGANEIGIASNGARVGSIFSTGLGVAATKNLFVDSGGDTYFTESSANVLDTYVQGVNVTRALATGFAVTGTLSATGVGSASRFVPTGATDITSVNFAVLSSGAFINTPSGTTGYLAVGGSGVAAFSSTGLAVTGTLSSTGNTGIGTASPNETGENANQRVLTIKGGAGTGNGFLELSNFSNASAGTLGGVKWVVNSTRVAGIDATGDGVNADSGSLRLYAKATGSSITTVATISPTALTLGSGVNLVMASGKGIDFSATSNGSGTTTSEVLSDYEEGTWTPTLGGTATYTTQSGTYTKVGRMVMATCRVAVNSIGTGSTSNIFGLPFTAGSTNGAGVMVGYYTGLALSTVQLSGYVSPSSSQITLTGTTVATTSITNAIAVLQNSSDIVLTAVYYV